MSKIYAIVKRAYVGNSENPLVFIDLFAWMYHRVSYEFVCGYSLGHQAQFYNTLDDAKFRIARERVDRESGYSDEGAIIELEMDDYSGVLTGFWRIYEFDFKFNKVIKKINPEDEFFKEVWEPVWDVRAITGADLSANALPEINRHYLRSDYYAALERAVKPDEDNVSDEDLSDSLPPDADEQMIAALCRMTDAQKRELIERIELSRRYDEAPLLSPTSDASGVNAARNYSIAKMFQPAPSAPPAPSGNDNNVKKTCRSP